MEKRRLLAFYECDQRRHQESVVASNPEEEPSAGAVFYSGLSGGTKKHEVNIDISAPTMRCRSPIGDFRLSEFTILVSTEANRL